MAELAFGMAGEVIEKLGSVAWQELGLAWGVKSDLRKLERTMPIIREVLLDAEKRQASDPLLRLWLGRLNDVVHDAEDVLDEIEYQALRKQVVATYGSTSTKVRHFFSSSMTRAIFPFKLARKIKGIRERLDEIAADKDQFNLTKQHEDGHIKHRLRDIDLISFVHPSTVIGRDEDKENIINLLMDEVPSKNVSVISIVGLGGLGKTTLAKWVYNDEGVVGTFQLRMWVCVSEDFSVTRLIKEILKSACGSAIDDNWNVDTLQTKLRERLKDNKFLLVLDDVWNEDRNKWIELRDLLIDSFKGSKIIVTTRSNKVASIMSIDSTYNLEGLSQDDCLTLFMKHAFEEGEEGQNPNLLEIGKEIVKKCKGVPLAVRTLGSMLHSKVDECEWKFVRDNEIWKLEQKESDILPALRLSYNHMPIHLKRCFAFCSLFPKDYEFFSFYLIQMWMAHGLIVEKEKQELEDVGDSYINELLSRSFFQDIDRLYPIFPYYRFKMHDLIHDLVISVARGECSAVDSSNKDNIAGTVRHLSFSPIDLDEEVPKCLNKLTKGYQSWRFCPNGSNNLLILYSAYASNIVRTSQPCLNGCQLSNHFTRALEIIDCPELSSLPEETHRLTALRSLKIEYCLELSRKCKEEDKLKIAHVPDIKLD